MPSTRRKKTRRRRAASRPSGAARARRAPGAAHAGRRADRRRLEAAFAEVLASLGPSPDRELARTPARAAKLWLEHLTAGEGVPLERALGPTSRSRSTSPVSLFDIGVHLVCPHHLTIAFGQAHVAYVPAGRIVGFGALARLVQMATSRLALQEDVTTAIADALVTHLGARAAAAVIEATHPCHNVLHPRSHGARAVTWAVRGDPRAARRLERDLRIALTAAGRRGR